MNTSSDERVDIVLTDKVSEEPARKIKLLATEARGAHDALKELRGMLTSINGEAITKLQKEATGGFDTLKKETATWKTFVAANMSAAMKEFGGHGAAMKELGAQWRSMSAEAKSAGAGIVQSTNAAVAGIDKQVAAQARLSTAVEKARAQQNATGAQAAYNELLGVNQPVGRSARGSMAVFQQDARDKADAAKATADLERRTIALKAAIDPAYAAQMQFDRALGEANALLRAGTITQAEHAAAVNLATTALNLQGNAQKRTQDLTKLTRFQVLTLQYTINDVAASLASGASPFTILMQQGGQVTQAWGGLLNTLRAAGGAIMTVTGVTVGLIAAGAGVLFMWDRVNANMREVDRQLKLTSGSAGLTAGQFLVMADTIAVASRVSIGTARETAMAYASTGKLQKRQIEELSIATGNFAKLTGEDSEKIVKSWSAMTEGPTKFASEFTMQYGIFTAKEYEHIKLLEDTGNKTAALEVVSRKLYDYYGHEAPRNLSLVGEAWYAVGRAMGDVWEWTKKLLRGDTIQEQLANAQKALANLQEQESKGQGMGMARTRLDIEAAKEKISYLQESVRLESRAADGAAARTQAEKDGQTAIERISGYSASIADNSKRAKQEIDAFHKSLSDIAKVNPDSAVYLNALANKAKIEEGIRKKWMPEAAKDAKKLAGEEERLGLTVEAMFAELYKEADAQGLLSVEREKANKLAEMEIKLGKKKSELTASGRADAIALIDDIENQKRQQKSLDSAYEAAIGPLEKYRTTKAAIRALLNAEAISTAEARRQTILNTEAYKQATDPYYQIIKQLKQQAELINLVGDEKEVAAKMQQHENELLAKGIDLNEKDQEGKRAELLLLEKTAVSRGRIMGVVTSYYYQTVGATIELAAKTDGLNEAYARGYVGLEAYRYGLLNIGVEMANLKMAAGEGTFADALLIAFEKNLKSMEDALVNFTTTGKLDFKSMVTAMIQELTRLGVIRPMLSGLLGSLGFNPGSGIASALSGGSSLLSGGGGSGLLTALGIGGGATALTAANTALGVALTGDVASSAAAASAASAAAGASSGVGAALSAIPVWGWAALAAGLVFGGAFGGGGGGPKTEGGYAPGALDIQGIDIGGNKQGSARGDVAGAKAISRTISEAYSGVAEKLGIKNGKLNVGIFYAMDNAEGGISMTQLQVVTNSYNRSNRVGGIENVARGEDALKAEVSAETTRVILAGLLDADSGLPAKFKSFLSKVDINADPAVIQKAIDDASIVKQFQDVLVGLGPDFVHLTDMSVEASVALGEMAGGLDKLATDIATYVQNFYSPEEQRKLTAENILRTLNNAGVKDLSVDDILHASRKQFRDTVEYWAKDTSDAGQRIYVALMAVSGAFASITPAAEETANAITEVVDNGLAAFREGLRPLAEVFPEIAGLSDDATLALGKMAGGLDKLLDNLNTYYKGFYSPQEQRGVTASNILRTLQDAGVDDVSLADVLGASRKQFRTAVEYWAKDTSDAGKRVYLALLSVSGAFASITPEAEDAAAAANAAKKTLRDLLDTAFNGLKRAVNAEKDRLNAAYELERASLEERIKLQQDSVARMQQLSTMLADTLSSFNTDATLGMTRNEASAQIGSALAGARGGVFPQADSLKDALSVITRPSADLFTSFVEYSRDFDRQAAQVAELSKLTDGQLSTEEQTLKALQDQLVALDINHKADMARLDAIVDAAQAAVDALNGINSSVLSVAAALNAFNVALTEAGGTTTQTPVPAPTLTNTGGYVTGAVGTSAGNATGNAPVDWADFQSYFDTYGDQAGGPERMAWYAQFYGVTQADIAANTVGGNLDLVQQYFANAGIPSFDVGTNYVPRDMLAMVHAGEAITPARYNPAIGGGAGDVSQLTSEFSDFAYEQHEFNVQMLIVMKRIAGTLEDWNENGMPDVREVGEFA